MCIYFYFHHTDPNYSIKSHIVMLNSLEMRILTYMCLIYSMGGWGGGGLKPPKSPLESATVINFKLNLIIVDCQVLFWGYSVDI